MSAEVRVRCSRAGCGGIVRVRADEVGERIGTCGRCGDSRSVRIDSDLCRGGAISTCPCCSGREFFLRKDFPQWLGLMIVIDAAIASCVFLYLKMMMWVWIVLGGAVLVDAALYFVTGIVTVCYRCRAEFRGVAYNPAHTGFDLATSEKYAQVP